MSPKRPLREDVRKQILERLLKGDFAPGTRINESALSAELGVSRTPLREALLDLTKEGFLRSDLARGFTVRPLTAREIQEMYPILWTLECLALRMGEDIPDLHELKHLNNQLLQVKDEPASALEVDSHWHDLLIAGCLNQRLHEMIGDAKKMIRRYEYTFMWDEDLISRSYLQHQKIISALNQNDIELASQLLETHWRTGMTSLLEQITI
ncbi:GntR family transcriptional regulator [Brevibacillus sp. NRS-1366]|uniref:GntR family transcriptional regulator n=1 Tax=Brevibacillus sp. NRS-1366 TaxID=3233899 RepID=UPI003D24B09B